MIDHMLAAIGAILLVQAVSPDIMGRWLIDDGVSVVDIATCGDSACGNLIAFPSDHGARDLANSDPMLRDRKIRRLELLTRLRRAQSTRWEGSRLYDPESGVSYAVSAHFDASRLQPCFIAP